MRTFVSFTNSGAIPSLKATIPPLLDAGHRVILAFDEKDKFQEADIKLIGAGRPGELYSRPTDFKRNGKMRGWTATLGLLDVIVSVCDKFAVPGAFKLDSDTLVRGDLSWAPETCSMAGFHVGRHMICAGSCYWIHREAASRAAASMRARFRVQDHKLGEDRAISSEVFYLSTSLAAEPPICHDAQMTGLYRTWNWQEYESDIVIPELANAQVIHFGTLKNNYHKIAKHAGNFIKSNPEPKKP